MSAAPAIVVESLSRRFGAFVAVDRVSFDVGVGEIFGYLGANGAGKSTTIRMLCGLLAPSDGDAVVAGRRIARDPESVKSVIGYMSQKFSLYMDLTVEENVEFFGGAYGLSAREPARRGDEVLERVGLASSRTVLTGELPGGIRQRLAQAATARLLCRADESAAHSLLARSLVATEAAQADTETPPPPPPRCCFPQTECCAADTGSPPAPSPPKTRPALLAGRLDDSEAAQEKETETVQTRDLR